MRRSRGCRGAFGGAAEMRGRSAGQGDVLGLLDLIRSVRPVASVLMIGLEGSHLLCCCRGDLDGDLLLRSTYRSEE
jgi:hypothetical protein